VAHSVAFADHHDYDDADIHTLFGLARQHEATLITTAKDAVRLPPQIRGQIAVMDIALAFDEQEAFDALLYGALT
jgi:tetraacyldisaccharide 4'-kinase